MRLTRRQWGVPPPGNQEKTMQCQRCRHVKTSGLQWKPAALSRREEIRFLPRPLSFAHQQLYQSTPRTGLSASGNTVSPSNCRRFTSIVVVIAVSGTS